LVDLLLDDFLVDLLLDDFLADLLLDDFLLDLELDIEGHGWKVPGRMTVSIP
jgi:hypothetical protein